MGKDPDTIYRELSEHRERLSRERAHLQDRVQSDLEGVRARFRDHSPNGVSNIGEQVSRHPLSYIAGGFGAGVVMGMLAPGMSLGRGGQDNEGRQNGRRDGQTSSGGLTGALSGTLISSVEDTVRPLMRDIMAGFSGDERPPEWRDEAQGKS